MSFCALCATGNEVAGTPGYMAIEVEQKGTADVLSDVFSAGVTLLELWVGSIGPTFDEYEGVDEVGPEGTLHRLGRRQWTWFSVLHSQELTLAHMSRRRYRGPSDEAGDE